MTWRTVNYHAPRMEMNDITGEVVRHRIDHLVEGIVVVEVKAVQNSCRFTWRNFYHT